MHLLTKNFKRIYVQHELQAIFSIMPQTKKNWIDQTIHVIQWQIPIGNLTETEREGRGHLF